MKTYAKIISCLLILCLAFFSTAIIVAADDTVVTATPTASLQATATASPQATATPVSTPKPTVITNQDKTLAQELSNAYHITVLPQDIANLRVNNDLGYGGITLLYGLANASGKTVTDILAMRQQDLGWGDIAKSLGLKVSDIMKKSSSILKSAKMDNDEKNLQKELDKKPDHVKLNGNNADNGKKKQDNTNTNQSGGNNSQNTNNGHNGNNSNNGNNGNNTHKK